MIFDKGYNEYYRPIDYIHHIIQDPKLYYNLDKNSNLKLYVSISDLNVAYLHKFIKANRKEVTLKIPEFIDGLSY